MAESIIQQDKRMKSVLISIQPMSNHSNGNDIFVKEEGL
jgi:hypothetical protein